MLRSPNLRGFPVTEILAALLIGALTDDGTTEDIKEAISEVVDSVLTQEPPLSPSPGHANSSFQRVKEEIVDQIPAFLESLSKLQKSHAKSKSSGHSLKKKQKVNSGRPEPTSFSEEEPSDEELLRTSLVCVGLCVRLADEDGRRSHK